MARILKCSICGFETENEHYDGGMIDHENCTNDWNLGVEIRRGGLEEYCEHTETDNKEFERYVFIHKRIYLQENHPELLNQFDTLIHERGL